MAAILAVLILWPLARPASADGTSSTSSAKAETQEKVKGAKERRAQRFARLIRSFKGDRKAIYEQHGFPSSRSRREESDGRIAEHWQYESKRLHFVFIGDTLIRTE
jgi:hypothetical protein